MQTVSAKADEVERHWFVVDATDLPLGRLASNVASVIRGKHKPIFTPHVDTGDFVIVINADKVKLTGNKPQTKVRHWHSQYPGGHGQETYATLLRRKPELAIEQAVFGMLPKNRLGRSLRTKLKVYRGPTHPHAAQKPEALTVVL
jgi:large subunit ribosomal protein L13